jgi:signal transduction histidine kinase
VSHHGDAVEQWESIRLLEIPQQLVQDLIRRLKQDVVVEVRHHGAPQDVLSAALRHGGSSMFLPLRRGDVLIGILAAGSRRQGVRFDERQERIARGISQTASLALANARLVEELESANRVKSEFVASMSHELRTPLHHIISYNDLMLDGTLGDVNSEQTSALTRVQRSSRDLLGMIEAVLNLSRLESDKLSIEPAATDVGQLFLDVASQTAARAASNPNVQVIWDVESQVPEIRTDAVKLKMVIRNLVENAMKFTPSGRIVVRAVHSPDGIEISITDTGIGIDASSRKLIFEPFRKAETTTFHEGVGLGLYIVHRLVELLGGTLELESELGCGSRFRVRLPHRKVEAPAPSIALVA